MEGLADWVACTSRSDVSLGREVLLKVGWFCVQMVGCASRQLASRASDASSPIQYLPTYLHSLDLPLSSPKLEPAVIAVADAAANTLCTPRMIEILPKEGDQHDRCTVILV